MTRTLDLDVLTGFLEEARGCTPAFLAGIEQLDREESRQELRRQADCLKGAAALVGLPGLAYIAAGLEDFSLRSIPTATDTSIAAFSPLPLTSPTSTTREPSARSRTW